MNNSPTAYAPQAESYIPAPAFKYAPSQREIDYAQLVAAGADFTESLLASSLLTTEEYQNADPATLYKMATKLMNTPAVQERYAYYRVLHAQSMAVTVERVQQELAANAFADPANLFRPDGTPITNPHDIPRHARAAIKEFKIDKDGVVHVKTHDKLKAIQMVGDLQGHFDEANRAKAPQVTISLGSAPSPPSPQRPEPIDVTPTSTPTKQEVPSCLL